MVSAAPLASARRDELLERAYVYVLEHGMSDVSLRPLAKAIGSSPRVLLFLFGSKEALIGALLARARADELALLDRVRSTASDLGIDDVARATWSWLSAPEHRRLLALWVEVYARSIVESDGPWRGFAARTVADWLAILSAAQPAALRRTKAGASERTLVLAVLRGALLDLLATGDVARTTAAVDRHLAAPRPTIRRAPTARSPRSGR